MYNETVYLYALAGEEQRESIDMFLIPVRGRGVWHLYYLSRATQTRGVFRAVTNYSAEPGHDCEYAIRRLDTLAHSLGICVVGKWASLVVKSLENAGN